MHWTQYNQQRIQIQLQTVGRTLITTWSPRTNHIQIYNLTSQRDNDLSYRTAVASQRIAEATQRDGVLMKQLAAQSTALAQRTWRDGVDMRAMAVITLITLPGTFTAVSRPRFRPAKYRESPDNHKTLFSTSFFNFEPASSGEHVSPWIWLYFVVTAAFTALCLFGWYYSSQTMAQAAQKVSIDGEIHEDEKMQESDSRIHSAQEAGTKDTEISSLPDPGLPPESPSIDPIAKPNPEPVATTTVDSSNSSLTQPPPDSMRSPIARTHWDASDVWGTQSYGRSNKACAMCAQHIEQQSKRYTESAPVFLSSTMHIPL